MTGVARGGAIALDAAKPRGLPLRRPLYGLGPYDFTQLKAFVVGYTCSEEAIRGCLPQALEPLDEFSVSMAFFHCPEVTGMGPHDFAMPLVTCRCGDYVGLWVPYLYTSTDASLACYRECQGWPAVLADVELTEEGGQVRARVLRQGRVIIAASGEVGGDLITESATAPRGGGLMKAPRRGLRLAECQLLLLYLVRFLPPDVLADDIFRQTDRAHAVPLRPEVVAREVALPPEILPVDPDRRLPLQNPPRIRNTELRRDAQQQMHVVRQRVPFHQLHAVPLTQLPKNFPNPTSDLPEHCPFSILRHPHNVISAIPSDVGLALPLSHDGLLPELGSSWLETV